MKIKPTPLKTRNEASPFQPKRLNKPVIQISKESQPASPPWKTPVEKKAQIDTGSLCQWVSRSYKKKHNKSPHCIWLLVYFFDVSLFLQGRKPETVLRTGLAAGALVHPGSRHGGSGVRRSRGAARRPKGHRPRPHSCRPAHDRSVQLQIYLVPTLHSSSFSSSLRFALCEEAGGANRYVSAAAAAARVCKCTLSFAAGESTDRYCVW